MGYTIGDNSLARILYSAAFASLLSLQPTEYKLLSGVHNYQWSINKRFNIDPIQHLQGQLPQTLLVTISKDFYVDLGADLTVTEEDPSWACTWKIQKLEIYIGDSLNILDTIYPYLNPRDLHTLDWDEIKPAAQPQLEDADEI
jgi:hypothetical protein